MPENSGKGNKNINKNIYKKAILKAKWYELEVNNINWR